MLSTMRTGAKSMVIKTVLFGLLLLAMAGLAVMDVQGMFRRGVHDTTVARVAGEKINSAELQQMVQNVVRGQRSLTEEQAAAMGLPAILLDQEIGRRVMQRAAHDLGIIPSDKDAAPQVKSIISPLVEEGVSEQEALQQVLMNNNLSEQKLVSGIKSQIAVEKLIEALTSGARAPQQLVEDALQHRYEWREGEYFTLTSADIAKDLKEPTEDDIKTKYDAVAEQYALPEYRTFSVLVLGKKSLGLDGKIADDILKQHYEDNISDYKTPEMRTIAQLVVKDEKEARVLFDRLKTTKDLEKAAKAEGKDKATYVQGAYSEADLPAEFADKAFSALEGDLLEPVQTPLGWHILHVKKIAPSGTKSFDSVKAQIATELSEEKAADAIYERANKIDDMIAGGASLEEVGAEFKIAPRVYTKIDDTGAAADGKIAGLPQDYDRVLQEVFALESGEASQLIEMKDGSYVIAEVNEIVPSARQPLEKIKAEIVEQVKKEKAADLLDQKAMKLVERLQMGEGFAKIAAELGKKPVKTGLVQRNSTSGDLPQGLLVSLFSLDKIGQATVAGKDPAAVHVLRLSQRKTDTKDRKKEDVDALTQQLNRSLANDILHQYRAAMSEEYDVTINNKLIAQLFAPKDVE